LRAGVVKVCPQCGEIKPISSFKDDSLITGLGRFCLKCKRTLSAREYVSTIYGRREGLENELSRSDVNKLSSFLEYPERYATGTSRAKEKTEYLESIKHKFNEEQRATYKTARERFEVAAETRKEITIKKADYNVVLKEALNSSRSVRIRYKGSWRTIDPYSLNKTYVVAYCHFAQDIRTFRIDRIQGVELADHFSADKSLHTTAQSRLIEAPSYKGDGRYHLRY